ncbi:MAG: hypothetical protein Q8Q60_00970 [Candidatus Chromulinivorax sp.]|nr:hypothetical protein [Candidatus Chromulinivorax sp.]
MKYHTLITLSILVCSLLPTTLQCSENDPLQKSFIQQVHLLHELLESPDSTNDHNKLIKTKEEFSIFAKSLNIPSQDKLQSIKDRIRKRESEMLRNGFCTNNTHPRTTSYNQLHSEHNNTNK